MQIYKWTTGLFLVFYITLIFYPINISIWIPCILLAFLFLVITQFENIPFYLSLCGVAFFAQMAGGPASLLFLSYIPAVFMLRERGLRLKSWWLILPLFPLITNHQFIPYLIIYGSVFLTYYCGRKRKKSKEKDKIETATGFEQKRVRESITESRNFPSELSDKFQNTLISTVDLIFGLFEPYSAIMLMKEDKSDSFKVQIAKSKGSVKVNASIEKGPLSWFYNNSGILVNNEYNNSSTNLGYYKTDEFIKCFIATSIEINDQIKGIIVIDRRERIPFDKKDKEILKSVSKNLSTLFSLYRYMDASMLEAFRFHSLLNLTERVAGEIQLEEVRASIFETIKTSFQNVWAIFLLKEGNEHYITEEDGRRYSRPIRNSIIALALKKNISLCKEDLTREIKRPILLPEERDFGAKSLLFSPFKGNVEGGILLLSGKSCKFDKKDLMVLNLISDVAASSVEKAILYDHEREKAIRDGLTGTYNHRFFQEMMVNKIADAKRNEDSVSLLMLDIDNFKLINDRFGHQSGDLVLKKIGKLMKERIRTSDIIARYGGEEFAIILPKTSAEKGYKLAEILRTTIENTIFTSPEGINFHVTASIGVSEYPVHADNKDNLVASADRALYTAKEQGKNQAVIAEY